MLWGQNRAALTPPGTKPHQEVLIRTDRTQLNEPKAEGPGAESQSPQPCPEASTTRGHFGGLGT